MGAGVVSDDGERLAFSANRKNSTEMGIHLLDLVAGGISPILEEPGNWHATAWHPDGRQLLTIKQNSNTDLDVYLVDSEGAVAPRLLTGHEGEQVNSGIGFAAGGNGYFRLTDQDHEFLWLAFQPLDGGRLREIVRTNWDVEHAALSRDRRRLAFTLNEDGVSTFHLLDLETSREVPVPNLPAGTCLHLRLSPDGNRIAAVIGCGARSFDVYVADLPSGTAVRITESFLGGVPEADLVEPQLVHIPAFDGRTIPAWLYRPKLGAAGAALLSIHGGPEAQERPGQAFSWYQYLLSRGITILAPNIRGSTGYGISYQKLIHRDWGGDELKDIESCARHLGSLDGVDRRRIGVYGGSFGGFATLSAMSRLPSYWACGVDIVGPSNLVTFAKAVPPHWRAMVARSVGDPYTEEEFLMARSPITYVEQVQAPLLVLQGAMDPRVVKAESDQMVERLQGLGREVEYHVFDDEGHGFTKRSNQQRAMGLAASFLCRHLGVEE